MLVLVFEVLLPVLVKLVLLVVLLPVLVIVLVEIVVVARKGGGQISKFGTLQVKLSLCIEYINTLNLSY